MKKLSNDTASMMRHILVEKDYKMWAIISPLISTALSFVDYLIVYLDYGSENIETIPFSNGDDCYSEFQNICLAAEEVAIEEGVSAHFPYGKECEYRDEYCFNYGTGMQLKNTDGAIIASAFMINPDYYEN